MTTRSQFISLALFLISAFAANGQQAPPPTIKTPGQSSFAAPGITFSEITSGAGLSSFRLTSGTKAKDYIIEATAAGCAFFDFDNDGWLDLYLVNGSTLAALKGSEKAPRAALFHNNHNGTFTDVTVKAGVANERWGQGVCAGDFDNDGWEDLYVTNFGGNRLYHNNHDGTFTDLAARAGVAVGKWSTGCAFGDFDGDGWLDLFVAGYVDLDLNHLPPPATGAQAAATPSAGEGENTSQSGGMGAAYSASSSYCQYRGQRVMCGPRGLPGAPDHLFRNNRDGTFTDVSERSGVADKKGYYGFGVAWLDFDDDGKLDLSVANDSTPSYLYRNRGDGTFEDLSYVAGIALNENGREQAGMGIAVGDYDGDGRLDIHRTNFADDSNVLFHNDGEGYFTDVTFQIGLGEITIPFLGWGTNFFDYDNDGWLDLLVANGHVYPGVDAQAHGSSYKQRPLLFRNVKGKFHEVGSSAGEALNLPRSARGTAIGDIDNDGDLDILINNIDEKPALLRNDVRGPGAHWLTARLVGDPARKCPRDAIGSVVFCTAGGRRTRDEVASGRGYISQSDLRVHFGLGSSTKVDRFEVRWANGTTETFEVKEVDRIITIEQGKGR